MYYVYENNLFDTNGPSTQLNMYMTASNPRKLSVKLALNDDSSNVLLLLY